MKTVYIFSDGACSGNPGPGGWGAILRTLDENGHVNRESEISGGDPHTTNNRMELTGVIEALSRLKYPCEVIIRTDSRYVVDGITKGWAKSWKRNNWIKSDKKPALNPELWEKLLELCETHKVEFEWIKGHSGHPENERCDELAVAACNVFKNRDLS